MKMRLIDAERLISGLADWQLTVKDHSLREAIDECIKAIAEQPAIEAIPVSFLEKLRDTAQNDNAAFAIEEAIVQWRMKESLKDSDRKILYGEMRDDEKQD